MSIARGTARGALVLGLVLAPLLSPAGTIAAGEVRVVEGKVYAVDVAHRAVVLEVATGAGALTVGVTLAGSVQPRSAAGVLALGDVRVGERAVLKYTREGDRLVGTDLRVSR